MSLPAVRALKAQRPDLKIKIITQSHLSSVYKNIIEIDDVVIIHSGATLKNFFLTILKLRKYKVKVGILFPNSFQSALVMRLSGVRDLSGYKRELRGWMLRRKAPFPGKSKHQIDSYLGLISLFLNQDVKESYSNNLVFSDEEKRGGEKLLLKNGFKRGEKLIGISPAAAYGSSKEWPLDNFVAIIKEIAAKIKNTRFVVFGSESDEEKIKKIINSISVPALTIAGDYSLREAMTIISKCDIFLGNDSGLLHVADGTGTPAIGLFGPTSPDTTSPPGRETEVIYKGVECSPCSHRVCPIDHKCMETITVSEISMKIIDILTKVST